MSNYQELSISEVLNFAHEGRMLLPDIQRDYVWKINQIEELFESILQGYPIGSFIFWKTTKSYINEEKPNLYYFFSDFKEDNQNIKKIPEILEKEQDYFVVLDGQQRITSLYIALYGSYTYFSRGKGREKRDDSPYWYKKCLYYNLNYHKTLKEGEENSEKRFCFLKDDEVRNEHFKLNNLLLGDKDDPSSMLDKLEEDYGWLAQDPEQRKKVRTDLNKLFSGIRLIHNIHFYAIDNLNYDEALDIFVRINSSGTPLSKADLIFSTLISGWNDVTKEKVKDFLKDMNGNDFKFTQDYLMRFALLAAGTDTSLKIKSFKQNIIEKIRNNWDKIILSLEKLPTILKAIDIYHDQILSYNATMAIPYYIFKGGNIDTKNPESLKNVQKFLWIAFAKNLFTGASDTSLSNIREAINKNIESLKSDFPLNMFSEIRLSGGRNFIVTESDIDDWLTHKKGEDKVFLLLSLLYPDLRQDKDFDQDHCHPASAFKSNNLKKIVKDINIPDWQNKKDCVPNLQLLESSKNKSKGDKPLRTWFEEDPIHHKIEYLPKNKILSLELENFEEFFEERRKEMKIELMKIFGISASDKNNK